MINKTGRQNDRQTNKNSDQDLKIKSVGNFCCKLGLNFVFGVETTHFWVTDNI